MNNAEFGQPGEITVISKAGTNKIHGSAFWYHQDASMDAIPYTFPTTTKKPKLVSNTYGGSFGSAVVIPHLYDGHNKTFVFGAFEGWQHPSQTTKALRCPQHPDEGGGFFQILLARIHRAYQSLYRGSYGTALPAVNGAAAMLLKFYPDPNVGDPTAYTDNDVANYVTNKDSSGHSNQFDIRGDQYFGANQKFLVWGRFTWKNFPTNSPEPLLVPSAQNTNQSRVLKISANYTITPHIINEFGFGYTFTPRGIE